MRAGQSGWQIAYLGFAATRSPAAARHDVELLVARRALDLGPRQVWRRTVRKRQPPSAARLSVGTARHRGRQAWDDPPLIDRPVLPLARSTSHPSEHALAGEPVFRLVASASRLDAPKCRSLPRLPASFLDGARSFGLAAVSDWRPLRLRSCDSRFRLACRCPACAFHPSCGSSPGSSYVLTPIRLGLRSFRRSSSPGGPDRRAIRCVIIMNAKKPQVKRYFRVHRLIHRESRKSPETFRSSTGNTQVSHRTLPVHRLGSVDDPTHGGHNGGVSARTVAAIIVIH